MFSIEQLSQFKSAVQQAKESHRKAWEASLKLVSRAVIGSTLSRLVKAIDASNQPEEIKGVLRETLMIESMDSLRRSHADRLKQLTGLPATKAIRALCVMFGLINEGIGLASSSTWSPVAFETYLRTHRNPYDLLLDVDVASILDMGAGDLSFAAELAAQYTPLLRARGHHLVFHAIDRLHPGSRLGGQLHADQEVLKRLKAADELTVEFWGDQDMFALEQRKNMWPCYTMVTCHAPATPTFAYEPSRIAAHLIHQDLVETKGSYRRACIEGEETLEVSHKGRSLLFPPWKFDIKGPLALLNLIAQRGKCCILTSVDTQVFWEILSQLFEDPGIRPADVIYTASTLPEIFGARYTELNALPIGASLNLSDLGALRSSLPILSGQPHSVNTYRFRYVEVRRGAIFEGIPAGRTARLFKDMSEEDPPWWITLVPEPVMSQN